MHDFLVRHHDELLRLCEAKAAGWPRPAATAEQLKNGVPHFLDELIRNLEAESGGTLSVRDVPGKGCVFTIRLAGRQ